MNSVPSLFRQQQEETRGNFIYIDNNIQVFVLKATIVMMMTCSISVRCANQPNCGLKETMECALQGAHCIPTKVPPLGLHTREANFFDCECEASYVVSKVRKMCVLALYSYMGYVHSQQPYHYQFNYRHTLLRMFLRDDVKLYLKWNTYNIYTSIYMGTCWPYTGGKETVCEVVLHLSKPLPDKAKRLVKPVEYCNNLYGSENATFVSACLRAPQIYEISVESTLVDPQMITQFSELFRNKASKFLFWFEPFNHCSEPWLQVFCGQNVSTYTCTKTLASEGTPQSYSCECRTGYRYQYAVRGRDGEFVSDCEDVDECDEGENRPMCQTSSECVNTVGGYSCECPRNYVVKLRSQDPEDTQCEPLCADNPCSHGGYCMVHSEQYFEGSNDSYVCICQGIYAGPTCDGISLWMLLLFMVLVAFCEFVVICCILVPGLILLDFETRRRRRSLELMIDEEAPLDDDEEEDESWEYGYEEEESLEEEEILKEHEVEVEETPEEEDIWE